MLDAIIRFSIQHKLAIGIMTLLLVIWGLWSAARLPIDAVPDITNNQVQIFTTCPTLAGQEVEQLVTFPIEQSIANIPDIEEVRSISRFGLSVITIVFDDDVDIYFARQLVHERLRDAQAEIPPDTGSPELGPVSTGLGEVYQYILHPRPGSEARYSAMDLRVLQDWVVRRQLNGTPGVAEVNSFGGELKQYEVAVDPYRLKAMGVSIPELFEALAANNANTGGAYIEKQPNAYFIRGLGLATSLEDIRQIPVKWRSGKVPVLVRDIADVRYGHAIRYGAMTFNGEVDAVGGIVMMLKGENSHQVVERIKAKIPAIQKSLPDDVVIEPYLDRTDLVGRTIATVEKNLLEGALIVIAVLVLFLGNLRSGLIVASAIPLSMLFALGMMNLFGVSANLMSLGAIDFGLIVDGAVIIVEATLHHLSRLPGGARLSQAEMDREVFKSASRIRSSAAFGEIIILIVYVPILTLVGIEGKMFAPMAKTVGFAILGALILSLTYVPMMCALFLPRRIRSGATWSDRMMQSLQRAYAPLLDAAFRFKGIVLAGTVGLLGLSALLFSRMGGEFIPTLQEGDFAFHCILPQGSSLTQSIETSMAASRILKSFAEVKMVVGKTGAAEVPTDPMPPEATDLMVILKPPAEWPEPKSYNDLADAMMKRLSVIPGIFFEQNQPIQMRFNELMTGIRQDVAIKIFGDNIDTLLARAQHVSDIVLTVEGATEPQVERVAGLPQINIAYDRARLANYGLSVEIMNDVVSTAFAGKLAGTIYENERRFDLVVRLDSTYRQDIENVRQLMVPLPDGHQIPLEQVADIDYKLGPAQITRESGHRRIVVGFNVRNRDVASVVEEIQEKLDAGVDLPEGYYYAFGGTFENLQKASRRLQVAVPVSLLLIFILLYATFSSARQAGLVFTAIPMSAIGGVFALLARDMPFSISAGIGFIALFGVAVLNGIVLIGTFNQLAREGVTDIRERIRHGTALRLRPVLMTASVASLGFLPMALSQSAGAEVQRPLATVVIGGLLTATFLTLFVLPILYFLSERWSRPTGIPRAAGIMILGLMLCAGTGRLRAQVPQSITLDEALAMALQQNQEVLARELQAKAMDALLPTASEMPKTEVNALLGQYNSRQFDQSYQIAQSIPFPTLFGTRRDWLEARTAGARLQHDLSKTDIRAEVRTTYDMIRYYASAVRRLAMLDSLYSEFVRSAALRLEAGDAPATELLQARTRKGEVEQRRMQAETALRAEEENLRRMLNADRPLTAAKGEYTPMLLITPVDSASAPVHPAIALARQDAVVAEMAQRVEKAQRLPDIQIGYTNQSLIGYQIVDGQEQYFSGGDRFHAATIGLAFPLFTASKSRIRALDYERQAAEALADAHQRRLSTDLANANRAYDQLMTQYQYAQETALPNTRAIVSAAKLGYETGETSYIAYLLALETLRDIEAGALQTTRELNETVIRILSLLNQ